MQVGVSSPRPRLLLLMMCWYFVKRSSRIEMLFPFEIDTFQIELVADNAKSRRNTVSSSAPQLPALCRFRKFNRPPNASKCRWTSHGVKPYLLHCDTNATATKPFPSSTISLTSAPRRIQRSHSDLASRPPRKPSRATSNKDLGDGTNISSSTSRCSSSPDLVETLNEALRVTETFISAELRNNVPVYLG